MTDGRFVHSPFLKSHQHRNAILEKIEFSFPILILSTENWSNERYTGPHTASFLQQTSILVIGDLNGSLPLAHSCLCVCVLRCVYVLCAYSGLHYLTPCFPPSPKDESPRCFLVLPLALSHIIYQTEALLSLFHTRTLDSPPPTPPKHHHRHHQPTTTPRHLPAHAAMCFLLMGTQWAEADRQ